MLVCTLHLTHLLCCSCCCMSASSAPHPLSQLSDFLQTACVQRLRSIWLLLSRRVKAGLPELTPAEAQRYRSMVYGMAAVGHMPNMSFGRNRFHDAYRDAMAVPEPHVAPAPWSAQALEAGKRASAAGGRIWRSHAPAPDARGSTGPGTLARISICRPCVVLAALIMKSYSWCRHLGSHRGSDRKSSPEYAGMLALSSDVEPRLC